MYILFKFNNLSRFTQEQIKLSIVVLILLYSIENLLCFNLKIKSITTIFANTICLSSTRNCNPQASTLGINIYMSIYKIDREGCSSYIRFVAFQ